MTVEHEALKIHRHAIDRINHELLKLFAERFETVMQLGQIKKDRKLAATDPAREQQMLLRLQADWNDRPISATVNWELVAPVFVELFKSSAQVQS